ncbi:hypothetical protein [Pendulispora albinea]|uniref:Uncharacterized protein n=1 Tax=Pendulispora albinea TaxID=2741071 RepID=A0ABZ2M1Z7_9BACT
MVLSLGCTFLANFDDPSPKPGPGGEDGGVEASAVADGGPSNCPGYMLDPKAQPCSVNRGRARGIYCACNGLANYQGSRDDLVICDGDGGIVEVTACSNGCAFYPAGIPDSCDPCAGRADGKWCATEFGVDAGRVLMSCQAGRQAPGSAFQCPARCTGAGPGAACN